nr:MAG TPA: hypothetical protein [Caudoviricetes sp.]
MRYTEKRKICSLPDRIYNIVKRFDKVYSIHGINYDNSEKSPLVIECSCNRHWRYRNQLLRLFEDTFVPLDGKRELLYLVITWEDDGSVFVNTLPTNWHNNIRLTNVYFKEDILLLDLQRGSFSTTLPYDKDIYRNYY